MKKKNFSCDTHFIYFVVRNPFPGAGESIRYWLSQIGVLVFVVFEVVGIVMCYLTAVWLFDTAGLADPEQANSTYMYMYKYIS